MPTNLEKIHRLLKGIETGDRDAAIAVNEAKYIQHNPMTKEGSEGLADLLTRLSKTEPTVNMVRGFEDAPFVFAQMEYGFSNNLVAFEVFRFENEQAVEHWDNLQVVQPPNVSGRSMTDGPIELEDLDKTEENRRIIQHLVTSAFIEQQWETCADYFNQGQLVQHHPRLQDGQEALQTALAGPNAYITYQKLHRVLAQGNFVLSACEGLFEGQHSGLYDLYRIKDGYIVEQWNTTETIPPKSHWKNQNGKF